MSRTAKAVAAGACFALLLAAVATAWLAAANAKDVLVLQRQLSTLSATKLDAEKTRTELLALRLDQRLSHVLWTNVFGGLGSSLTALGALIGALFGLGRYLDARDKERIDRAAGDLSEALKLIASQQPRERAVGVVGLQHFFTLDKHEYHLRALSALMTAARSEDDQDVRRGILITVEEAVKALSGEVLRRVSWQGVELSGLTLPSEAGLGALDLRDAKLRDARLLRADLQGARLQKAELNGADLSDADLRGADLAYTDLAGAKLCRAKLAGTSLLKALVQDLDLEGADLRDQVLTPDDLPWEKIANWRRAQLPPALLADLLARFGPETSGPRVAMLLWEIPPLVAGGTWTASYHLVRALRQLGARVEVVVPWDQALIEEQPFGRDVKVHSLGIEAPMISVSSSYGGALQGAYSVYAGYSPYGGVRQSSSAYGYSAYGYNAYGYSAYGYSAYGYGPYGYGPYARATPPGALGEGALRAASSTMLRMVEEVARRFRSFSKRESFDLLHAHDWVMFPAARSVAERDHIPWVAHFHSTESDRRPGDPDTIVAAIERQAVETATRVITPSNDTRQRLLKSYGAKSERITVVPNSFVPQRVGPLEMGRFESKRLVFLGRLSAQKGIDAFVAIASAVRSRHPGLSVHVFGAGEEEGRVRAAGFELHGALPWAERGTALRDATVLLVPSRAEPFGMVVLEAMTHRVPVVYPCQSGAAEVLASGIAVDPTETGQVAARISALLSDRALWEKTVQEQAAEIVKYPRLHHERAVQALWNELATSQQPATRG